MPGSLPPGSFLSQFWLSCQPYLQFFSPASGVAVASGASALQALEARLFFVLGHPVPVGCGAASMVSTHQMSDSPLHHGSPCPLLWEWLPWTLKCSSQGVHAVEVVWGKGSIQSVWLPGSLNCASFGILAPRPRLTSFHGHFYLFLARGLVCHELFHC